MKKTFTFLLLIATTITFAQESILLRMNYEVGDKYVVNMTMNQNMGDGMMLMSMNATMPIEIKSVVDDVYESEITFRKITMNMNQGGMDMSYDSSMKEEEMDQSTQMMHQQMKPMLETVLSTKTNSLGKVIETKMIAGSGDPSQFTNQTQSVTYPEEKISVGYSWEEVKEEKGMTIKSTYTVKSIEAKAVFLDVDGSISGMAEGTLKGDMQIDRATGTPIESNLGMDMTVMGQKMTTKIELSMLKE